MTEGKEGFQPTEADIKAAEGHLSEKEVAMSEAREEVHGKYTREAEEKHRKQEIDRAHKNASSENEHWDKEEAKEGRKFLERNVKIKYSSDGSMDSSDWWGYLEAIPKRLKKQIGEDWRNKISALDMYGEKGWEEDGEKWSHVSCKVSLKDGTSLDIKF